MLGVFLEGLEPDRRAHDEDEGWKVVVSVATARVLKDVVELIKNQWIVNSGLPLCFHHSCL